MSAYNYNEISQFLQNIKNSDFNRSELLAIKNGFEVVYDEDAYNGRYFIKDGKKWIHNIEALKRQLRINSDAELSEYDYDVSAYYKTH
ncbi:hypothetical protein N5T82_10775 [Aliarcobacter cryaerophilus]|uniref:hypothetical protein n=1 Tax=Aliarcobacter cryaerophilus TaxID=28198 RepID=UPI0021B53852|nr:hypothetical protein [Aliarcobacter cryaerophilus]MCT7540327.1 hypothetical protein [Aliarcobacter cryaerophilus]